MRSFPLLAALILALAACQREETPADDFADEPLDPVLAEEVLGPRPNEPTIEELREKSRAEIDEAACAAKGGRVEQAGMLGLYRCTVPYADAGKVCRDGDDCEGRCLLKGDPEPQAQPGTLTGVCQATDSPFGCFTEIEDGSIGAALCVD